MVPFTSSSAVGEPPSCPQEATCEHCLRLQHQKDTQLAYLGSFSHDLRAPLASIHAGLELLSATSLDVTQRAHLRLLQTSEQLLAQTMDELLSFAQLQLSRPEVSVSCFHLADLLDEVIAMYSAAAEQRALSISVDLDAALPEQVVMDREKLARIFQNLLSNAIKFSEHGSVAIHAQADPVASPDAPRLLLHVVDHGVGIASNELKTLFQPFVQGQAGKATRQGTGLGLAICQHLTELLGGSLEIDSQANQGTHICVHLPYRQAAPQPILHDAAPVPALSLQILVVEDDPSLQLVATRYLHNLGHQSLSAQRVAQAAALIAEHPIDAVLLDVQLGEEDGVELAHWLRQSTAYQDLPIIFVSAHSEWSVLVRTSTIAHSRFLSKPLRRAALAQALPTTHFQLPTPDHTSLLDTQHLSIEREQLGDSYVVELIELFLEQSAQQADALRRLDPKREPESCITLLHRLQGSCTTLRLYSLTTLLIEAQQHIEQASIETQHIDEILTVLWQAQDQLRAYLAHIAESDTPRHAP